MVETREREDQRVWMYDTRYTDTVRWTNEQWLMEWRVLNQDKKRQRPPGTSCSGKAL